jgi:hypothetical protein
MKFKLLEYYNPPTKQLTQEQVEELLATDYSEAKQSQNIYRGIYGSSYDGPILVTPNPRKLRRSANEEWNFYTAIINNSPAWKEFPKRQTICSTSLSRVMNGYADEFSEAFRVYPKNGAKIGVCPEEDIWETGVKEANQAIAEVFTAFGVRKGKKDTYDFLVQACKEVDEKKDYMINQEPDIINNLDREFRYTGLTTEEYFSQNMPFLEFIQKYWITPDLFDVVPIKHFTAGYNVEVWTDAPALMIPVTQDDVEREAGE